MIKLILAGVWASAITIAAQYGFDLYRDAHAEKSAAIAASAAEIRKTKELNIPRIKDGVIKGYVVAQFDYVVDPQALKAGSIPPDTVVADEAFRYVYDDDTIDFDHLERFDLAKMGKALVARVNARLKAPVVLDIGVQEFTFLASSEAKQRL